MISLRSFLEWILATFMWSENLSLQVKSIFPTFSLSLIRGTTFCSLFFQKSYVSICSDPPTQYISNYKHLVVPTHPLFCLRNIWMAPYYVNLLSDCEQVFIAYRVSSEWSFLLFLFLWSLKERKLNILFPLHISFLSNVLFLLNVLFYLCEKIVLDSLNVCMTKS